MNNLILEILPDIQASAKKIAKDYDTQNELTQHVVLKCYEYPEVIKRLYAEKKLSNWYYIVMRNEYRARLKRVVVEVKQDIEDECQVDMIEEIKQLLSPIEREWLKRYFQEGSYINLEKKTGIRSKYISQRINAIIKKCKRLKHTLY